MRRTSVFASPVLVGAVTVLVTIVAVFLSYNANNGLPFVPTTQLKVRVANGANLVRGNEIRSGGFRVGVVDDMAAIRLPDGSVGAELTLKLDKKLGDIPRDSQFRIRPRSALGLKYLEITEGQSSEHYNDGDTVPVDNSSFSQDLDRVYEMFDAETRHASQKALRGFGDGFAGRGQSLGQTIDELPRFLTPLQSVMNNLASPETDLKNLFKELGDAARVVAPVSKTNARLFTTMANTFEAIGRDPKALQDFIEKGRPTEDVSIDSLKVQRPFLSRFADFSKDFSDATVDLRAALPDVNAALKVGIPVQRRAVSLNARLQDTLAALDDLVGAPTTNAALRGVTATVTTLNPSIRFIGPYVTVCNAFNYFFTYLAEHFSEGDLEGESQRALLNGTGHQDNSTGSMGATDFANGQNVIDGPAQYLHGPVYPRAINDDGTANCENGQRGYIRRAAKYLPENYLIHADPRTPGDKAGPTYTGLAKVPPGETFDPVPRTGPYSKIPTSSDGRQ